MQWYQIVAGVLLVVLIIVWIMYRKKRANQ
jgi:uncharacterized integral membrane protein